MANQWANKSRYFGKSKNNTYTQDVGSITQSQLVTTYAIGSIVDFLNNTVIIAGIDSWDTSSKFRVYNENLQSLTGVDFFVRPKTEANNNIFAQKSKDIPSYSFPEKMWCTTCKHIIDIKSLQHQKAPYKCVHCGKNTVVASRFVIACENGHIQDFPYYWWIHGNSKCSDDESVCKIKMYNVNNGNSIDSLFVSCDNCGKTRKMSNAFLKTSFLGENGFKCKGNHPHLSNPKYFSGNECLAPVKALLRSSSSVYFPVSVSALSIPPWSKEAVKIVSKIYSEIEMSVKRMRQDVVKEYLEERLECQVTPGVSLQDLIKAYKIIKANRHTQKRTQKDIYEDEYSELKKGDSEEGNYDFSTYTAETPYMFKSLFDKVIIVDRLTEVQALYGFTRIKPNSGDLNSESIAPLSMEITKWKPAVELRGEGIFIKFNEKAVEKWEKRVTDRYKSLSKNFNESYFFNERFSDKDSIYSSRYILLHSFSHLLMRQISIDCGYNVASLKEKIYSSFISKGNVKKMAGILIYLTSSDADGSLGGLTGIANNEKLFEKILHNALKKSMWCSADPLCISSVQQGFESLNYAACHDCLLVPETSCEFKNILLDRGALVGTIEDKKIGYFSEIIDIK